MLINKQREESFINKIHEVIEKNMDNERFGVSELAHELNMSRSNLHRRIKTATGSSVSQFLRKLRLHKALELLKEKQLTVSEAAYQVGFGSVTYFSTCFRNHFGFSPGEVSNYDLNAEMLHDAYKSNYIFRDKNNLYNFPVQTTSFIGREKEMEKINELIGKHCIVSLVGPGGCGKTRLACETVRKLEKEFKDGIWFIDLAPVEYEEHVLKQFTNTLGINEIPGKDLMDTLVGRIRQKELFILMDNCEHLLNECAELSRLLIEVVPGLSLLLTSRETMNIKVEKIFNVSPLTLIEPASIIDIKHAMNSESVRMFSDRAIMNNPGFTLEKENISDVASICKKVDGIPLAIEIVASRIKYMDTNTIMDRLGERFAEVTSLDSRTIERHKSLQATIQWSYNMLEEDEKTLFRKLSVFTGGFNLEAAEQVCSNDSLHEEKILELLCKLIDKSMVQAIYNEAGHMRYRMLETLKQFAGNLLLNEQTANEVFKKHLEYFCRIAEEAYNERIYNQDVWLKKIELEHNNMLLALRWAKLHDQEKYLRLAGNLSWFWVRSNHYTTANNILAQAITINHANKEFYAKAVTGYGIIREMVGDLEQAMQLLRKGLSIWQELKNLKEIALTTTSIAETFYLTGNDDKEGLKHAREAVKLAKEINNEGIELYCMLMLAQGLVILKNTNEARPLLTKFLRVAKGIKNAYAVFSVYHMLGDCDIMEGNYVDSERNYSHGLSISYQIGDMPHSCIDMSAVAMSVAGQGHYAKALRLNAAATKMAETSGFAVPEKFQVNFWKELVQQHIIKTRKKLGEALTLEYEEEGRALSFKEAIAYALDYQKN